MKPNSTHRRIGPAALVLVLASLSALGIAQWCMASGIGVSPDSVVYLSAADNVLAGRGLETIVHHFTAGSPALQPLVGFPPTYPLLLALSESIAGKPLNGAKWLHTILFALNVFLLGAIVFLATDKSAMAVMTATLLLLTSARFLEIQTMAWSEAPFVLFMLCALLSLMLQLRSHNYLLLFGAALSAGLALTTRYAGIAFLPPMVLTILLLDEKSRRIRNSLVFAGVAILPLVVWIVRNVMIVDSATRRTLAIHAVGIEDLDRIATALIAFELPALNLYLKVACVVLGAAGVGLGFVLTLRKLPAGGGNDKLKDAALLCAALFIISYLLFLVACNATMRPLIYFDPRMLVPVYTFGIILLISLVHKLTRFRTTMVWSGFLLLSLVLICANAVRAWTFAKARHSDGSGFNSREWTESATVNYLRTHAGDRTVYSNAVDAIHFLTNRDVTRVPARFDPMTGNANQAFEDEIKAMREDLLKNRTILVQFDRVSWRWYLPSKAELENGYNLPVLVRLSDGVIYGMNNQPETALVSNP